MRALLIACVAVALLSVATGAPVRAVVFDFVDSTKKLTNHQIERMETGEVFHTDDKGYLNLDIPVGEEVTLISQGDLIWKRT
jgi:hypothetical protein